MENRKLKNFVWPFIIICLCVGFLNSNAQALPNCTLPVMATDERPDSNGKPTKVTIGMLVADITSVDDVGQAIEGDFFVKLSWRDKRLDGLDGCRFHRTKVWFPQISLLNSHRLTTARVFAADEVKIEKNGFVSYFQRYYGSISTYHQLQRFPFDRHLFKLRGTDFDYGNHELSFVVDEKFTRASNLLNVPDWKLHSVKGLVTDQFVEEFDASYSLFTLEIDLSRNSDFYIRKVLTPLVLIVMMSWVVFWVDPEKFGPQIGLSVTAMLTLIAFQFTFSTVLPKLSYFTTFDSLLLGSTVLVFFSLIEATITTRLVFRGKLDLAQRLDSISRWAFPLAFVALWIFVLV